MAAYDIKSTVGKNRPQTTRRVEIPKLIDFTKVAAGVGPGAADVLTYLKTPKNFVFEDIHPISKVSAGAACTVDIGTAADPDGLLDGGSLNVASGTAIAKAGTEAVKAGTLISETDITITVNNANAAAKFWVVLIGYVFDF